jgi:hypothetical protein
MSVEPTERVDSGAGLQELLVSLVDGLAVAVAVREDEWAGVRRDVMWLAAGVEFVFEVLREQN